jgi:hypothetical protein
MNEVSTARLNARIRAFLSKEREFTARYEDPRNTDAQRRGWLEAIERSAAGNAALIGYTAAQFGEAVERYQIARGV